MTDMKLGVETYVRFSLDQKEFRFFAPIHLSTLLASSTPTAEAIKSSLQTVAMADVVINLGNNMFVKNRGLEEQPTPEMLRHAQTLPITEYDEVVSHASLPFNPNVIGEFKGEYRFLSNFYPAGFVYQGILWPNSEAAYQAMKSRDRDVHLMFSTLTHPVQAKHEGRMIDPMREDWDDVKVGIMRDIVYSKFNQNPELKRKLFDTGNAILQEGNTHNDRVWGISPPHSGNGKNHLGKILMDVRRELKTIAYE